MDKKPLYIFLDEGGDFNFSPSGSKYFTMTCVCKIRPFKTSHILGQEKYNLIEFGLDFEYFHCCQDNKHIRDNVFSIIGAKINSLRIDSVVVEKRKTGPTLQLPGNFYPKILGYLLRFVVSRQNFANISTIFVITDTLPIQSKKKSFQKTIKKTLVAVLPKSVNFKIMHHSSRSTYGLQIADYCNWAIFRKWEQGDDSYHKKIKGGIKSEFDIFSIGKRFYY